jgi:hypothetical protein
VRLLNTFHHKIIFIDQLKEDEEKCSRETELEKGLG